MFVPGVAYEYSGAEFRRKGRTGLLTSLEALVVTTTDEKSTDEGSSAQRFWIDEVSQFCGISKARIETCFDLRHSSYNDRNGWLESLIRIVETWR